MPEEKSARQKQSTKAKDSSGSIGDKISHYTKDVNSKNMLLNQKGMPKMYKSENLGFKQDSSDPGYLTLQGKSPGSEMMNNLFSLSKSPIAVQKDSTQNVGLPGFSQSKALGSEGVSFTQ